MVISVVDYTRQKVVVSVDYTRQEEVLSMNHEILKRVIYDQREVIKNAKIIDRGIVLEKDTNNVLTGCGRKPVFFSAGKGNKKSPEPFDSGPCFSTGGGIGIRTLAHLSTPTSFPSPPLRPLGYSSN